MATKAKAAKPGDGVGGAGQDQHGKQSHAGGDASTAVWFKLYPGKLLALSHHEPDDMKFAKRHREIALALAMQEEGMDSFADELMQSTAESMRAASEHARKAAEARWEKERQERERAGCPSNARASDGKGDSCPSNAIYLQDLEDSEDLRDSGEKTRRDEGKKQPRESSRVSSVLESLETGNALEYQEDEIAGLSSDELAKLAVRYCQEGDPAQAFRAYKKAIREIGPESFREELQAFASEVKAGADIDSRGATFNAKIQYLLGDK